MWGFPNTMGPMRFRLLGAGVVALSAMVAVGADRAEVKPPVRATLALPLKGETIEGMVTAWDDRVVVIGPRRGDAPAVEIAWVDVDAAQAYKLRTRLMDSDVAASWLSLGILMLDVGDVERADRALAQAVRLDATLRPVTKRIAEAHAAGGDARALIPIEEAPEAEAPGDDGAAGGTEKPEPASDVPADFRAMPWPDQTPEQRAAHVEEVRAECRAWVRESGVKRITEVETEYFLFFTDLSPSEVKRWSKVLDGMYRTLIKTLEMPEDALLFYGKCAIFIFNARHDFLAFEQKAMGIDATRAGGICHMRGPKATVVFFRGSDDARFQSVLVHETVHAFMHRYRSAASLPTWANEGLADYVAGVLTPMSNEPREHWMHAKQFAQLGKDAGVIMRQNYRDGSWFTEDSYPISHMLVRFLLTHKPREFKEWIDDIKGGADWAAALEARFGVTHEVLAKGFVDAMKSEQKFTTPR
jgi:hypothetical protein